MTELLRLLRRSDLTAAADALRALGAGLTIGGAVGAVGGEADDGPSLDGERRWLEEEGVARLGHVLAAAEADAMVAAVAALRERGLPAVFLYVYDQAYPLGARIAARVSAVTGADYALVEDLWAWRVERGRGRGWPPHRGLEQVLDRRAPELVNTWVALSPASADRACIHFVSLPDDPGYPADLARTDAALAVARAAPLDAGEALAWNANVLHWGGPCSPRARGPRTSCSFSLVRRDALDRMQLPLLGELGFAERLVAIARQIATYGEGQPDVSPEVLAWGRATWALRSLAISGASR